MPAASRAQRAPVAVSPSTWLSIDEAAAYHGDARVRSLAEPLRTVTAAHRGELALIAPTLIQTGYAEREGQSLRVLDLAQPLGTAANVRRRDAVAA